MSSPGHPEVTSGVRGDLFDPACPTRQTLDRLGSKWVAMIVASLDGADAEVRFADLRRRVAGISQKVLSSTLRELERDGLVARRVEPSVPPAVHYSLTTMGRSFVGPIAAVRAWTELNMRAIDDARDRYDRGRSGDVPS